MMKLKSIVVFRLKINMKKMKEAEWKLSLSDESDSSPVLQQQSFQMGNHVTFRNFLEIARYLFSRRCESWIGN